MKSKSGGAQAREYRYQLADSKMTLREGMDEYYRANPTFGQGAEFLKQDRRTVTSHDAAHVFFGLGCSSAEELLMETMTLFACKLPKRKVVDIVRSGFLQEVMKEFGPWRLFKRLVTTSPRVLRAIYRAIKMNKKWPHFDYEPYLDRSLESIRSEFGFRVGL